MGPPRHATATFWREGVVFWNCRPISDALPYINWIQSHHSEGNLSRPLCDVHLRHAGVHLETITDILQFAHSFIRNSYDTPRTGVQPTRTNAVCFSSFHSYSIYTYLQLFGYCTCGWRDNTPRHTIYPFFFIELAVWNHKI